MDKNLRMAISAKIIDILKSEGYDTDRIFTHKESLQLTRKGCSIMEKVFDAHSFPHNHKITSGEILAAYRTFKYPFYLSSKRLVVFNKSDAVQIQLYGDVGKFFKKVAKKLK